MTKKTLEKENEEKIRESVKEMLCVIPEANYNILKYFIRFLADVGKNAGANRMGPRNLALVFGASLLNPPAIDQYDLANIKLQCSVIEHMITGYSYYFEGEESNTSAMLREKAVATIPAGNPKSNLALSPTSNSQPSSAENRKKSFMKRKSTFFVNVAHGSSSSSRVTDIITPKSQRGDNGDPSNEKKTLKKHKKSRKKKSDEGIIDSKYTEEVESDSEE